MATAIIQKREFSSATNPCSCFLEKSRISETKNLTSFDCCKFKLNRKLDSSIIRCIESFAREFTTEETPKFVNIDSADNSTISTINYGFTDYLQSGLFLAVDKYLGINGVFRIEDVRKMLPVPDEVQNDPLLWQSIHIDYPLNHKITDDELLRLTDRAHGGVLSLSLFECVNITTTGLRRVFETNPGLTNVYTVLFGVTMVCTSGGYVEWGDEEDFANVDYETLLPWDPFSFETFDLNLTPVDYESEAENLTDEDDSELDNYTDPHGVDYRNGAFVESILNWINDASM